jgi:prepilin-type N-terminal cleavage/methylation domain-containing protein
MIFRPRLKTYSRGDAGFTLVEVLVSLTIMALITSIAFAGLSAGIDSWRRGTRKIQEMDRRVSVERLLKRQLSLASGTMKGTASTLEFVSPYSLANGPADAMAVKYAFESGTLQYVETPPAQRAAADSDAASQSLGAFTNIQFGFLSKDPLGKPTWLDEWNAEGLPTAVRAKIDEDVIVIPVVNR